MREPPAFRETDPASLSLAQLTDLHEALGRWLEEALAAAWDDAPDDDLYQEVYFTVLRLAQERVLRQQGELPRG
ncbi:MAG: hypothetical protein FJ314_01855 [SAR202 cluster bacterium]|nr:hypothetical protein [SAR202 cluster bacterium]